MGRYSERLAVQFAGLAGVAGGQRVLDVGCGPGALTAELVGRVGTDAVSAVDPSAAFFSARPGPVAAVDPSAPFVSAVRERLPGVDVRLAPPEALPFPDGTFDAALAQLVVH